MSDLAPRTPPAIEGEVLGRPAENYLWPADDLEFVLNEIKWGFEVNDPEHDPGTRTDADLAVASALHQLTTEIRRRQAVARGPHVHVDYCGVDGELGTACGPHLGLPLCGWHGRPGRDAAGENEVADDRYWTERSGADVLATDADAT